jgi:hypothetical protein
VQGHTRSVYMCSCDIVKPVHIWLCHRIGVFRLVLISKIRTILFSVGLFLLLLSLRIHALQPAMGIFANHRMLADLPSHAPQVTPYNRV